MPDLLRLGSAVGAGNAYAGQVLSIVDGDTLRVQVVDVLLSVPLVLMVRVLGVNARELHDPGGREARAALAAEVPPGTVVTLRQVQSDKYAGRLDAQLVTLDGLDVGAWLVSTGWAAAWDGRGERPLPPWPIPPPA